jgi:hypothetical protein
MATQAQTPKPLKYPEAIPIDPDHPLNPTHALFLTHNKDLTSILDFSSSLSSLYFPPSEGNGDEGKKEFGLALSVAATVATVSPAPPIVYTVKRENLVGTRFTVKDGKGKEVAEWKCPILSLHMGRATVKFLTGEQAGGIVEVESTGFGRKAEVCWARFHSLLFCSPGFRLILSPGNLSCVVAISSGCLLQKLDPRRIQYWSIP